MPWLVRPIACLAMLAVLAGGLPGVTPPAPAIAARVAASPVGFTGPDRGAIGSQTPGAGDFTNHCNSQVSSTDGHVGSTTIPSGTALQATAGCGVAVLTLAVPANGRFHALFGVSADDTSGKPATVRVRVVGQGGYDLRFADVTATRAGGPRSIDVDVSRATALTLSFLSAPTTFAYGFSLSGSAHVLRPTTLGGNGLPAGATPVNLAGAAYSCNAHAATAAPVVARLTLPTASSATGTSCGSIAFPVSGKGTLVLRYGADDTSSGERLTVSVRVLAADGHLLRKAIGVTFLGAGLRPLWVGVAGARSVNVTLDGSTDTEAAITSVGILPRILPLYAIPDRTLSGGGPGGSVAVDPEAFVSGCNSTVGTSDITVARAPVFAGTYFATYACGTSSLIFCCTTASGTFHALFGVPDNASVGSNVGPPGVTVVALDKNNHPLRRASARATPGAPGAPVDIRVDGASTLSFAFHGSSAVLYGLRLTGPATIADYIYPPTAPPTSTPGGVAIDPRGFTLHCNAYLANADQRLIGATTLEGWALYGESCGEADLSLAGHRYPRHRFSARIGIKIGESPATVVTIRLNVLNAAGKVIRHSTQTARYGYGTQPIGVGLAGGATLQILWTRSISTSAIYAMTAS